MSKRRITVEVEAERKEALTTADKIVDALLVTERPFLVCKRWWLDVALSSTGSG